MLETGHDKIMVLRSDKEPVENDGKLDVLFEAARLFEVEGVRRRLQALVPEYEPPKEGMV